MATAPSADPVPAAPDDPTSSGCLPDGSLDLYYERSGSGPTLVLLHGAFGTIESCFADLLPRLTRRYDVVAVELEAHGRSPAPDRPLTYSQMADDLAALILRLGIAPTHVAGYSMGGAVGMQLALTHPHLVDRLIQFGEGMLKQVDQLVDLISAFLNAGVTRG